MKAAQEELRCDALQEVQFIENMYTTQYTPLLSTVNEQQSVFGLDELERTSAMKDSDIASLKRCVCVCTENLLPLISFNMKYDGFPSFSVDLYWNHNLARK